MLLKTRKRLLAAWSLTTVLTACALVAWQFLIPPDPIDLLAASSRVMPSPRDAPAPRRLTIEGFEAVWETKLRRPLVEEQPPAKSPKTPAKVATRRPPIKLLGTVIEEGRSMALLQSPREGAIVVAVGGALGDTPDAPRLVSVDQDQAKLQYRDETVTIQLERE